jgi:two-component system LytT family sensor kinase
MKRYILIASHILFWSLILSFFLFVIGDNAARSLKIENPRTYIAIHFGLYGLINISIFYVNLYLLIPLTINKKKYTWYVLSMLLAIVLYGLLKYLVAINFKEFYLAVGPDKKEISSSFNPYFFNTFLVSGFMIGLSLIYKVVDDWIKNESIQRELTYQKTQAELQFLKSQINPHFLFNSLNNIYALAYKKSDDAPSAILKLSEIMRYMLKESEDGLVDVHDELQYLNSYIDLNRIRYKEGVYLDLEIDIGLKPYRVMPMLLISFIENIFKHGLVNESQHPVKLSLSIKDGVLYFSSSNKIRKGNKDESSGIGLKNIFRRLDLVYGKNYSLKIKEENEQFDLSLMIKLVP